MGDDRLRAYRHERAVRQGELHRLVAEDQEVRGSSLGRGGAVGGLWNCCLAVLVGALLVVIGFWVWIGAVGPAYYRQQARADLRASAAEAGARLRKSAADGTLFGTEIDRDRIAPVTKVRRQGRSVTVTARFTGGAPAVIWGRTETTGCYEFRVRPPAVSVHRLSDGGCGDLPSYPSQYSDGAYALRRTYRPSAEVAADVVGELRAAYAQGSAAAVYGAAVWQTPGIRFLGGVQGADVATVRAWLSTGSDADARDCYEFDARPGSLTAEKLARHACDDPA
ncbi:hypothetical protein ABT075_18320 [Streptomyces sp. NPDC002677]|uniref:hypothetical protein n=1 Tax=Streptomyces sp. NPDC002677 TaxID=3154774 RepID=UPI00333045D6